MVLQHGQLLTLLAATYGLRVKAYSIETADFQYIQLPAIIHWDFDHFIVVERWSSKKVDVIDPSRGRRQLSAAEFNASFTGIVLTFDKGAQFQGQPHGTSVTVKYIIVIIFIKNTYAVSIFTQ